MRVKQCVRQLTRLTRHGCVSATITVGTRRAGGHLSSTSATGVVSATITVGSTRDLPG